MQLVVNKIKKSFGQKKVLQDISFIFEAGHIYALLGKNGSGKTTLFNCLNNNIDTDSGDAEYIDDNGVKNKLRPEYVGYVSATPILPGFLTGYEVVKFFIDINREKCKLTKDADYYLDMVKLNAEDRNRLIKDYSLGMKNKIQMLSFIITQPPIILLDEPITSLDIVTANHIKTIIRNMKENHIIIFSTHILNLAKELSDRIVVLNQGRLTNIENPPQNNDLLEKEVIKALGFEE